MKHTHFLGTFLVFLFTAAAQAMILLPQPLYHTPPEWADQARTTFNAWDFSNVDDLGGTLIPEITDGMGTLSFADYGSFYDSYDGLNGVVEDPFQMTISIDNFPEPLAEKRVWIELNWATMEMVSLEDISSILIFSNSTQVSITHLWTEEMGYGPDSQMFWNHSVIEIVLWPNPEWEDIVIDFYQPLLLDSVFAHTICQVPEPATLSLLGLGSLAVLLRKN